VSNACGHFERHCNTQQRVAAHKALTRIIYDHVLCLFWLTKPWLMWVGAPRVSDLAEGTRFGVLSTLASFFSF
jgi:esterase/lipase superfamily enzyme